MKNINFKIQSHYFIKSLLLIITMIFPIINNAQQTGLSIIEKMEQLGPYVDGSINGPHSFTGIYSKAKVFDAENATDLLNAFLNIGNKLRAIATNTSISESEEESTSICTTNEECYYEQRIGGNRDNQSENVSNRSWK